MCGNAEAQLNGLRNGKITKKKEVETPAARQVAFATLVDKETESSVPSRLPRRAGTESCFHDPCGYEVSFVLSLRDFPARLALEILSSIRYYQTNHNGTPKE